MGYQIVRVIVHGKVRNVKTDKLLFSTPSLPLRGGAPVGGGGVKESDMQNSHPFTPQSKIGSEEPIFDSSPQGEPLVR